MFASLQRRKRDLMPRLFSNSLPGVVAVAAMAAVPQQTRVSINRITGGKGAYVDDDGAYSLCLSGFGDRGRLSNWPMPFDMYSTLMLARFPPQE